MCGIFGFFRKEKNKETDKWFNSDTIIDTIMHFRRMGVDGIGYMVFSRSTPPIIAKHFLTQGEFILRHGSDIAQFIDNSDVSGMVFHNRWATRGTKCINGVHPFDGPRFVVMHNGSVEINKIHVDGEFNAVAHSDTERITHFLNQGTIRANIMDHLKNRISHLLDTCFTIGVLIIYDKVDNQLYIYRDNSRKMMCNYTQNHITQFWNDNILASRFATGNEEHKNRGIIQIDIHTGNVTQRGTVEYLNTSKEWMSKKNAHEKEKGITNAASYTAPTPSASSGHATKIKDYGPREVYRAGTTLDVNGRPISISDDKKDKLLATNRTTSDSKGITYEFGPGGQVMVRRRDKKDKIQ